MADNKEMYNRFVELQNKLHCTELELEEWSELGTTLAREYVPVLLAELAERLEQLKLIEAETKELREYLAGLEV